MNRFDIVRGQSRAWSILARAYASHKVASTYLFCGPEGVGGWSLAIEFAALLNCEKPQELSPDEGTRRPCGECRPCRAIFDLNFEGLHLIVPIPPHKEHTVDGTLVDAAGRMAREKEGDDPVTLTNEVLAQKRQEPFCLLDRTRSLNIPIEIARDVKRRLALHAPEGITRVVLFYRMDDMQWQSADALLKMIEEPPPDTIIIMTAVRPEGLAPTILSRAQKIRLLPLPEDAVVAYLTAHYDCSETAARLAARVSQRSLGRAIAALPSEDGEGGDPRGSGLLLFKSLMTESNVDLVARMSDLLDFNDRGAAQNLIRLWQSLLRDCAYYANASDEAELVNVDFVAEIKRFAGRLSDPEAARRMIEATKITLADLELNVHIQPALVAMALKLKAALETGGGNAAP